MQALLDKGRVSGMLNSIPIYAVMVENLGERGAQYQALKMLNTRTTEKSADLKRSQEGHGNVEEAPASHVNVSISVIQGPRESAGSNDYSVAVLLPPHWKALTTIGACAFLGGFMGILISRTLSRK